MANGAQNRYSDPYAALGVPRPSGGASGGRSSGGRSTRGGGTYGAYWGKNRKGATMTALGVPLAPGQDINQSIYRLGNQRGENMLRLGSKSRQRIYQALLRAGVITSRTSLNSSTVDAAWRKAMAVSGELFDRGKRVTPWEVLEGLARQGGAGYGSGSGGSGGGGGGGGGGFSGTLSQTSKHVQLTDPKTAEALVTGLLQRELGRAPKKRELREFVRALHRAERKNPQITTTTSTYSDGRLTSSTSTTKGGLDAAGKEQVLEDWIDKDRDLRAERQAEREAHFVGLIERLVGGG